MGFGCDLALACDLRILSERAYLQEIFVKIGVMSDGGGSCWLPRLVGLARAMELLLTGDPIPAAKAVELGIANRMVADEALLDETMKLAQRIAAGPALAHAGIKRAVRDGIGAGIEETLRMEKEFQLRCLRSSDFQEGVTAWLQKREPDFKGE